MTKEKEFKPKILVFCCNWCSYAAADLAGVSRLQMPPDFRVVRVMCSARVRPEYVIKAIARGVDGVMILGCHIGDCHYISGNHRTKKRFAVITKLLEHIGVNPKRVLVDWVSAAEGHRYQELVTNFVKTIKELGPNELGGLSS
ncbi:MAG: methyl-viologen-reducing hydrogenase subunit delta [Methanobacteriota archaeon]|nr:MAG: methyl-viologen-reducing hydrogenase subunit delta [Euryarchaeota archaeon]